MRALRCLGLAGFFLCAAHAAVYPAPADLLGWQIDKTTGTLCLNYTSASCLSIGTMSAGGVYTPQLTTLGPIDGFQVDVPGALFDGTTNDVVAINAAIDAARTAGGGTIILPPRTTHIGSPGIILKSYVRVLGQNGTKFICDTNPCTGQAPGSQLVRAQLSGITFEAGSGQSAATVMAFPAILYSDIGPFQFKGFTGGKALSVIGAVATAFDEATLGSNTVFNNFHDWTAFEDGFDNPIEIRGAYGASPPTPSQVATINKFHRMSFKFRSATAGCINLISGVDSNSFEDILCQATGTGAKTFIYQSNDATYSTVLNYVNANTFTRPIFSVDPTSTVTNVTLFGGYFNHATMVYGLTHDINQTTHPITFDGGTLNQSLCNFGGQAVGGPGLHTGTGNVYLESFCTGLAWNKRTVFNTPTTGATILGATTQGYDQLQLQNAANIATLTVRWPCAPREGQHFTIGSQLAGVNELTVTTCESGTPMSTSVGRNPFRMVKGSAYTFRYLAASNTWIQHTTNTQGGPIEGNTNASNAVAGDVGQIISSSCRGSSTTATITVTIASPAVVTWTAHPFRNDATGRKDACPVVFTTTGALPTGITAGTTYWVAPSSVTTNTFQIATTIANALASTPINTSGSQSGTHTGTGGRAAATGTVQDITGIILTPGNWSCTGLPETDPASGTVQSRFIGWLGTAVDTIPERPNDGGIFDHSATAAAAIPLGYTVGPQQRNVSANTNLYMGSFVNFTTSTLNTAGHMQCLRIR